MRKLSVFFIFVLVICVSVMVARPVLTAVQMPDEIVLTDTEYASPQPIELAKYLTGKHTSSPAVDETPKKYITIKLFGIIPIKKVLVNTLPFDTVRLGGLPIGIKGDIDGTIVCTDYAEAQTGDIIVSVNDNAVHSSADFTTYTKAKQNVVACVRRNNKLLSIKIDNPDALSLRDTTNGVGILTFVNPENNNFSALGHQMGDFDTGVAVDLRGGSVKAVHSFGIEKTVGKKTGIIKSSMKSSSPTQGVITHGDKFGVAGCLTADSEILSQITTTLPISTRYNVKSGSAILRTCLDGKTVEEFKCEILKTKYQNKKADKSMVIRITDEEMLSRTGGILHGMSGSPIIQNGHLVGVLTHATTSDPAKGYAVYIDFVTV